MLNRKNSSSPSYLETQLSGFTGDGESDNPDHAAAEVTTDTSTSSSQTSDSDNDNSAQTSSEEILETLTASPHTPSDNDTDDSSSDNDTDDSSSDMEPSTNVGQNHHGREAVQDDE